MKHPPPSSSLLSPPPSLVEMLLDEEADMLAELEVFLKVAIKIRAESEYNQEHYDVVLL